MKLRFESTYLFACGRISPTTSMTLPTSMGTDSSAMNGMVCKQEPIKYCINNVAHNMSHQLVVINAKEAISELLNMHICVGWSI
jgi:hypothetical protein